MDCLMPFGFELPTRIEYGPDRASDVGRFVNELGGKRVLVVTDPGIAGVGLLDPILEGMDRAGQDRKVFDHVSPNPKDEELLEGAEAARAFGADVLVAVGGGSVLDCAKGVAVLARQGGRPQDYSERGSIGPNVLPLIAVPTTAGSASEVTFSAVITDTAERNKFTMKSPLIAPRIAVLDPGMTKSMPAQLTAATGMDALTHAIEAYTVTSANALSDAMALAAVKMISAHLVQAVTEGLDMEARAGMLLGSLMAGIAFSHSDVGAVHCLAEAMGGVYDAPHGACNAVILSEMMAWNREACPARYARIAEAMGVRVDGKEPGSHEAVRLVRRLAQQVGLPGIRALGLKGEDFADLARRSVHNGSNGSNPRAMAEEDYIHVLEKLWEADPSGYAVPVETLKGTPRGSTGAGPEKWVPDTRRPEVVRQRNRAEEINYALFRISNAVNTTHDLSELYASIHDTLERIIDVTNFYIAVHEPERGVLTFPYHHDETDDDFEDVPADLAKVNSLTGQVFLDQRPVLLHERQLRERKAEARVQGPVPLVWLGVPLMVRNKVIGVMAIQSYTDPNRYDDTDVEVLTAVSEQIAVAVERKRAEEALARSERRFREMADLLPTIICEIDHERRIRYMNRMGLETFSGSLDAGGASLTILDLIHPEDRDRAVVFLDAVTEEGGMKGTEVRLAGFPETETAALIHASTITREGEVRGSRLCITDVTQRKRLEAELQRTHKMETIGTLAGGIAHDFNNILAIIMGSLSLAKTGRSTGEDIEVYLANAEEATITARDLIQRFITFSKGWQPAKKRTPIRELVESSVRFVLDGTPIACRISMPDSLWPVEVDRAEMGRAINNLVMNAREAMPRGGTLDIQAENLFQRPGDMESDIPLAEGPYLKIAIGDQGPGIAREHLPFIFDPYFSTKERGSRKGMGLGLTTAYSIVQKHRGLLQAESSPGRGTTFFIYLPAHPPD